MANQILRTGTTPIWGLASGTAAKSKACAMLLTSANVSTSISDYEQLDSEGRKCGYVSYDAQAEISLSGNIIYDSTVDNFETVAELFTVGAAVEDEDALALLEAVRVTNLPGTEASGYGTYVCKSFDITQTNTDAVGFDATITYYGFGDHSLFSNGPLLNGNGENP